MCGKHIKIVRLMKSQKKVTDKYRQSFTEFSLMWKVRELSSRKVGNFVDGQRNIMYHLSYAAVLLLFSLVLCFVYFEIRKNKRQKMEMIAYIVCIKMKMVIERSQYSYGVD